MTKDGLQWKVLTAASIAGLIGGSLTSWLLNAAVVGAAGAAGGGRARLIRADVLRVKRVVVTDREGARRVEIGADLGSGVARIYDNQGKPRVVLGVPGNDSMLALYDDNGKVRVAVGAGATSDYVRMFDQNGQIRAGLGVRGDNSALAFSGADGLLRTVIGATGNKVEGLTVYDSQGKTREMAALTNDQPVLQIQDGSGKVIWTAVR
jgi:hypothetical protein